jgi:DNA-binding transcriptional MerR regulator
MSDEDNAEFKKLYRQLVFKLHPDLNPKQSKDEINLWHRIQLAYQGGDLEEIRSLIIVLESQDKAVELPSSKETLEKRKKTITGQIQKIIAKLSDMEKEFPFNIAKNLTDKDWVSTKLQEIGESIRYFEDKCKEYNELLKLLIVSKNNGVN